MLRPELTALDEVSALVVVLALDGRVVWWNRAFTLATGFACERLPIAHFTELVPRGERPIVERAFHELPKDPDASFEYPLVTARGETRWVAWSSRIMDDEEPLLISTGIDRTREHTAFERLRASERRMHAILCGSVDAAVWFDEERRITFFNEAAERLWGYRAEEVMGCSLMTLLPPEQRGAATRILRIFMRSPRRSLHVRSLDLRGRRKDGSEFSGDLVVVKFPTDGSWTLHASVRDVTARRRVEQEQRFFAEVGRLISSSHERDEILSESARLAVRFVADCCVVDVLNPDGIERLACAHGDPEKEGLAKELCAIRVGRSTPHPICIALAQRRPFVRPTLDDEDLVSMAQSARHLELLRALAPRSFVALPLFVREQLLGAMLLWSTTPQRYDEDTRLFAEELGRRVGLALENARLYGALQAALRARDDVLRIVAHDLRTPLGAIQMAARALRLPTPMDESRAQRSIDVIERSSARMSSLIDDLLDIARMEGGGLRLRRKKSDAREIVEEAVLGARPLAEEAGLELLVRVPPAPVVLHVDRLRCVQILTNLLGNALKFTPRGGRVEVLLEEEPEHALFLVRDTGPGISSEVQARLFEPFWQRRRATGEGAGLGLAIARALVRAHGGEIGVESALGAGSTFWFRLPRGHPVQERSIRT